MSRSTLKIFRLRRALFTKIHNRFLHLMGAGPDQVSPHVHHERRLPYNISIDRVTHISHYTLHIKRIVMEDRSSFELSYYFDEFLSVATVRSELKSRSGSRDRSSSTFYFHPDPRGHIDHRGAALGGSVHSCPRSGPRCDLSGREARTHRRNTVARAYANVCKRLSGLGLGPARGSPRTNPVTRPTRLATEQLVCTCNRCLPPGGSRSLEGGAGSQCMNSGHPAPINTLAFRSVYQPRRPGALRSTRKPPVQGRCRTCRWERELG